MNALNGTRGQKQIQHAKQKRLKNGAKSKVDNFPPKLKILKKSFFQFPYNNIFNKRGDHKHYLKFPYLETMTQLR